MFTFR